FVVSLEARERVPRDAVFEALDGCLVGFDGIEIELDELVEQVHWIPDDRGHGVSSSRRGGDTGPVSPQVSSLAAMVPMWVSSGAAARNPLVSVCAGSATGTRRSGRLAGRAAV